MAIRPTSASSPTPAFDERFEALLGRRSHDPHSYLGIHREGTGVVIRAFIDAEAVTVVERGGGVWPMEKRHEAGLFVLNLPKRESFAYHFRSTRGSETWDQGDPYRFLPQPGELDLHLFNEGNHQRLWEVLGAHPKVVDGEAGVAFAVWAPGARSVALIGGFNGWNNRTRPMRAVGTSGVWELFVPGIGAGEHYKYVVIGADGVEREKSDPFGFEAELRPRTASVVASTEPFAWSDDSWMTVRPSRDHKHLPMSIYEVHPGSWRRGIGNSWLNYREIGRQLADYCREMNYTHVELMPILEHPFDGSWGYQVTNFFAPTSRFGTPDDLRAMVDMLHAAGIGVLLDWVPAHFPMDAHGLGQFDGTYLYEHQDERRRIQPDWNTLTFNYGRHEVRNFLLANAVYWVREFHIDGLRVDAVSSMLYLDYSRGPGQWTPNRYGGRENLEAIDFLRRFNELVHEAGGFTVAEESTSWPGVSRPTYSGGLGFTFKWNMGWMHDTLEYFALDPVYRRFHQNVLTFSILYAWSEDFILSISHDEVVHLKKSLLHKMPGDEWQQFANLRLLLAYQSAMPGKKLLFMGSEFGQRTEWNHDNQIEWQALGYHAHEETQRLTAAVNRLHIEEPALHRHDHEPRGFAWLDFADADQSVLSFVRRGDSPEEDVICVFNFTPVPRFGYRIPAPGPGSYREILNTDSALFGGGNIGNAGAVHADQHEHNGHPWSFELTLPPLGALFLRK